MLASDMRIHARTWVAVAICVAVLLTFLVHKPACSDGRIRHNQPVPAFRAVTAKIAVKAGAIAAVEVAVIHNFVVCAPQLGPARAGIILLAHTIDPYSPSGCFRC